MKEYATEWYECHACGYRGEIKSGYEKYKNINNLIARICPKCHSSKVSRIRVQSGCMVVDDGESE